MRLRKEVFAVIVQTKVESQTKNIDPHPLLLIKLIELRKPISPALAEKTLTLDAFRDIE